MPRLGLCVQLSEEGRVSSNLARIWDMAVQARQRGLDAIFFGEAFLQGFDSLAFQPEKDRGLALALSSGVIISIRQAAIHHKLAIGFGFYELDGSSIYSSYLVVGEDGQTLCHYRRISPGWRYPDAPACYREGKDLIAFPLKGRSLGLVVCGDLWEDTLMADMKSLCQAADALLWPVHCDYPLEDWENGIRAEYVSRTRLVDLPVLFVNNLHTAPDRARGGAYRWQKGQETASLPAGQAGMLEVSI